MKIETDNISRQIFDKVWDIHYWMISKSASNQTIFEEFDIDYFHGDNDMVQEISNQLDEDLNGEQNEN